MKYAAGHRKEGALVGLQGEIKIGEGHGTGIVVAGIIVEAETKDTCRSLEAL